MTNKKQCGFTLIEILIVLSVLGILMAVLATQFLPFLKRGEEYKTVSIISQVQTSIELYENEQGDYPPSDFHGLASRSPNEINVGMESLVACLFSPSFPDKRPDQKWLVNTDEDQSDKVMTDLGNKSLFEIADAWGNPLVYIHNRDYAKSFTYRFADPKSGEWEDQTIEGRKNKEQGDTFFNAQGYQLISAGADGKFGTKDDLTNFSKK